MNKLEFKDFSLVHEREPFPTIYMTYDSKDVSVWFKVFINFAQEQRGLTIEKAKKSLSRMVDIDEWEVDRDICNRWTELYGIKSLIKSNVRRVSMGDNIDTPLEGKP